MTRSPIGRRAGSDDRDLLLCARFRNFRTNPSFLERMIDDGALDHFNRDRRLIDAEHACRLARGRADAAGELGEVVGGMQHAYRGPPPVAIDQIIPVRNDVVQRAAGVAEGHAAIHAARTLCAHFFQGKILIDLQPVVNAFFDGSARGELAGVFQKTSCFTHDRSP